MRVSLDVLSAGRKEPTLVAAIATRVKPGEAAVIVGAALAGVEDPTLAAQYLTLVRGAPAASTVDALEYLALP
ncbi:MAG: hypothetical protein V3T05_04000, partial [Myxococcota bacterium]